MYFPQRSDESRPVIMDQLGSALEKWKAYRRGIQLSRNLPVPEKWTCVAQDRWANIMKAHLNEAEAADAFACAFTGFDRLSGI